MKKLIFALVAGLAVAPLFAVNSVESIRWQVSDAKFKGETESLYFNYAMVAIGDGRATKLYLKASNGSGCDDAIDSPTQPGTYTDSVYSLIPTGCGEDDTFYVQLYDNDDNLLGFSDGFSYDDLLALDAVYVPGIQGSGAGTWTVSTFNVPEPTSGLLMLLGIAGLALKRKRA